MSAPSYGPGPAVGTPENEAAVARLRRDAVTGPAGGASPFGEQWGEAERQHSAHANRAGRHLTSLGGCAVRTSLGTIGNGDVQAELYQLAPADGTGATFGYVAWNPDCTLEVRTGCRTLAAALAYARAVLSCGSADEVTP